MKEGMDPSGLTASGGAARLVPVAALYVMPRGCYSSLPGVDLWDEARDARKYPGPFPVVAHPPCERWGRYWNGGPSARVKRLKGDDNGCFEFALINVRFWGGVLEHPAGSAAWGHFGLTKPPRTGGWVRADDRGWTCCVDQGHYGHRAQKATWLYAVGCTLPDLVWGKAPRPAAVNGDSRRAIKTGLCQRLSRRQRTATPPAFRDLLIAIAQTARSAPEPQAKGSPPSSSLPSPHNPGATP